MGKVEKILTLNNQVEAKLLESILHEREIPFLIRTYYDSAYDGLWQAQAGWGHVEAPSEFREEILKIYSEMA